MISKILPYDKTLHCLAGIIIYLIVLNLTHSDLLAAGYVSIAAIGKEIYDGYIKKTFFDWIDILYTLGGGIISFLGTHWL